MKYSKKAQVLLTEEEYKTLEDVSLKTRKKMGTLIREAVEKVYIAEKKNELVTKSVDRILSLSETPVPEDYNAWEDEYSRSKGSGR